jgi:hypothetical protein
VYQARTQNVSALFAGNEIDQRHGPTTIGATAFRFVQLSERRKPIDAHAKDTVRRDYKFANHSHSHDTTPIDRRLSQWVRSSPSPSNPCLITI